MNMSLALVTMIRFIWYNGIVEIVKNVLFSVNTASAGGIQQLWLLQFYEISNYSVPVCDQLLK